MLWLFTGDSITQGAEHTDGARSYPQLFEEWIRYEMGRSHDVVVNTAISGNFADDLLAEYDQRIARLKPDAVVVMLGTNDATLGSAGLEPYRAALARIVGRAADEGADVFVLTPPAVSSAAATRTPFIAAYAQAAREVARERKATLADIFAEGMRSGDGHAPDAWMHDAIHPNALGHREIARLLVDRMAESIVKNRTKHFFSVAITRAFRIGASKCRQRTMGSSRVVPHFCGATTLFLPWSTGETDLSTWAGVRYVRR